FDCRQVWYRHGVIQGLILWSRKHLPIDLWDMSSAGNLLLPEFGQHNLRPLGLIAQALRIRALGFSDGGSKLLCIFERFIRGLRGPILPGNLVFQASHTEPFVAR